MEKNKVLIIDDVKIVCVAIRFELAEMGYESDIVLEYETALKMVKNKKYDIVFIDLLLDNIDGVKLCKMIKRELPEAILILMTGYIGKDLEKIKSNFVKAGGSAIYLEKPFLPRELVTVINDALAEKKQKA
ncbi:MAG: response regulator [Candidatus Omnitrophota bacterium]